MYRVKPICSCQDIINSSFILHIGYILFLKPYFYHFYHLDTIQINWKFILIAKHVIFTCQKKPKILQNIMIKYQSLLIGLQADIHVKNY